MKFERVSRWVGVLFTLIFLFAVGPAQAQNTGSLRGQVTDPSGAAIAKANVDATNNATGTIRTTQTDASGSYVFAQVQPGTYTVKVSIQGFKTFVQGQVTVLVATPTTLNIKLELGAVSEQVTVESSAMPALNTTDATVGNPFGEAEVKNLPFAARNPVDLLTLQPGVVTTGSSDTDLTFQGSTQDLDERDGVVNGVRSNQSNITLDGVNANNWETQAAFTSVLPVTLDSVQEFRVTTTNANATEGQSGGAQVALVTKGGTQDFHGGARWYYRSSFSSANPFFNKTITPPIPRGKLVRHIGGGSFGGPVPYSNKRLFFFTDFEARRESRSIQATRVIPSEALKQGTLTYRLDDSVAGFDPNAAGVFPCPAPASGFCRNLIPSEMQTLDPAGLGVNQAMLDFMAQFPVANDPSLSRDDGLAFGGFRFNSPVSTDNNIYTARIDYKITESGSHTVYWRGTLGDIKTDLLASEFPGADPNAVLLNNSKGMALGYTAQLSPWVINTVRYGFTRAGIASTGARGDSFRVRSFSNLLNFNRATASAIPNHEFRDDLSWIHGNHTFQFGGVVDIVHDNRFTDALTFPDFTVNDGFCQNLCTDIFRSLTNDTDPNNNPLDRTTFVRAQMMLLGAITQVSATFFVDPKTSTFLPPGTTPRRTFKSIATDFYFQDNWKLRPNVTLTYGLHYSYETPVWEVHGNQVGPAFDVRNWFSQRIRAQEEGLPSDATPLLSFDLAGKTNHAPAWWQPDTNNFAPRLALAWSPGFDGGWLARIFGGPGQSSIRAGAGVYFARVGGSIATDTDINGSFGLSDALINGAGDFTLATTPRFSGSCTVGVGCSGLPPVGNFLAVPATATFPAIPASNFSNLGFVVDNRLSTPYSINATLDFQRQLPKGFVVDVGYVGTFGHQLLTKTDLSQSFIFLKDPQSGVNISQAYNQIVDLIGPDPFNPATPVSAVQPIPFFENMLPNLPDFLFGSDSGLSPTQAFYILASAFAPDWGDALAFGIDTVAGGGNGSPWNTTIDPQQDGFVLYQPQFDSLPAWVNWGNSNYHSLQLSVRRTVGSVRFGANYVFSKSIDNGSAPENADLFSQSGLGSLNGQIPNPFLPGTNKGLSDFDIRHNFSAWWLVDLPFGQGHRWASNVGRAVDAVIGGWQFAGSWRWRSGFPITPGNGFNFPTNFFLTGPGTILGSLKSSVTSHDANGFPNVFKDPAAAKALFGFTRPGAAGSRSFFSGPSYFKVDLSVHKTFNLPIWGEGQKLQFRASAFNVFNNVSFNDNSINALSADSGSNFGRFTAAAGTNRQNSGAREMEFALRFEF